MEVSSGLGAGIARVAPSGPRSIELPKVDFLARRRRMKMGRRFELNGRLKLPYEEGASYLLNPDDFFAPDQEQTSGSLSLHPPRDPSMSRTQYIHRLYNYVGIGRTKKKRDFGLNRTNLTGLLPSEIHALECEAEDLHEGVEGNKEGVIGGPYEEHPQAKRDSAVHGDDSLLRAEAKSKVNADMGKAQVETPTVELGPETAVEQDTLGECQAAGGGFEAADQCVAAEASDPASAAAAAAEGEVSKETEGGQATGTLAGNEVGVELEAGMEFEVEAEVQFGAEAEADNVFGEEDGGEVDLEAEAEVEQSMLEAGNTAEVRSVHDAPAQLEPRNDRDVTGHSELRQPPQGMAFEQASPARSGDQAIATTPPTTDKKHTGEDSPLQEDHAVDACVESVIASYEEPLPEEPTAQVSNDSPVTPGTHANGSQKDGLNRRRESIGSRGDKVDPHRPSPGSRESLASTEHPPSGTGGAPQLPSIDESHEAPANCMEVVVTPIRKRKQANRNSLGGFGTIVEDGVRRSTRIRTRPLEYWRNEHFIFTRGHQTLPTISGVELCDSLPQWPLVRRQQEKTLRKEVVPFSRAIFPY